MRVVLACDQLLDLREERHDFSSAFVAQDFGFKSKLVRTLGPLDRVQFPVEFLTPVVLTLLVKLRASGSLRVCRFLT